LRGRAGFAVRGGVVVTARGRGSRGPTRVAAVAAVAAPPAMLQPIGPSGVQPKNWLTPGVWMIAATGGATAGEASPGFVEDLRAGLPAGLAAALPAVAPEVLFVAVGQVRAGRDSGDLEREFGLSPHDAETIRTYAAR